MIILCVLLLTSEAFFLWNAKSAFYISELACFRFWNLARWKSFQCFQNGILTFSPLSVRRSYQIRLIGNLSNLLFKPPKMYEVQGGGWRVKTSKGSGWHCQLKTNEVQHECAAAEVRLAAVPVQFTFLAFLVLNFLHSFSTELFMSTVIDCHSCKPHHSLSTSLHQVRPNTTSTTCATWTKSDDSDYFSS